MKNPYESQSRNKFWKTAVSSIKQNDGFQDLWNPKFQITKESKISTLGSCFAQHISHWLTENEYSWQNFETAPNNLSNDELSDYGYGIYSCRVGNIYTPSMLRQWLQLAKNGELSFDEVYEDDGKYFDPLRPQIPKYGHLSMAELNTDRFNTLQALNRLFNESDVFIFTMGLTEAWVDTNGVVYQVCPGTVKGEFNPEIHKFKNYTYDEVLSDMIFVIDAITKINGGFKHEVQL